MNNSVVTNAVTALNSLFGAATEMANGIGKAGSSFHRVMDVGDQHAESWQSITRDRVAIKRVHSLRDLQSELETLDMSLEDVRSFTL